MPLALRLSEGLGGTPLLVRIALLYEKPTLLPPAFGPMRTDNRPALARPSSQLEKGQSRPLDRQLCNALPKRAATWQQSLGSRERQAAKAPWVLVVGKQTVGLANAEGRERCVAGKTCVWLNHDLGECNSKARHDLN
jgi:hypothetical protein